MDERRIPDAGGKPTFLRFRTARQIGEETDDGPEAIVPGLLIPGALVELTGQVKRAGKTTFTLAMVAAVLDGRDFLGRSTLPTRVVYLTEQSGRSFKAALSRAGLLERDDLSVLSYHDTVGVDWPIVVQFAVSEAAAFGAGWLVVDTLSQFAHLAGDSENDAGTGLAAVAPLQAAIAGSRLAVLLIRHDRKAGGDVGESARGSSAIDGAVDIVLQLKRAAGNRPRVRELNGIGRFDDTPDTLMSELGDDGTYTVIGDDYIGPRELAKRELLARMPPTEADALDLDTLTNNYESIKKSLAGDIVLDLWKTQKIHRTGPGRKGHPYRYWRTPDTKMVSVGGLFQNTETHSSFPHNIYSEGESVDESQGPLDDYYERLIAEEEDR